MLLQCPRDGTEVSGYERICPYPHDDKTKQDYPTNRNLSDVKELKEILYQKGYYKPEPHSEAGGILHEYPNNNLVDAIRAFQRDNKLPATGTMNALTIDKLMEKVPKPVPKPINIKMSNDGIEWLKKEEGNIKHQKAMGYYKNGIFNAYKDTNGNKTIGYGHKLKPGESFPNGITEKQADELLRQDVKDACKAIERQIDSNILSKMKQHQHDALVSLVYNIGPGGASKEYEHKGFYQSTIRKYINNPNYKSAEYPTKESAWRAFDNKGMLSDRRDAEWRMFENADYSGRI